MDLNQMIAIRGDLIVEIHDAATGKLKSRDRYKNMVVTSGKNAIADGLRGTTANNKGIITYCALGTGVTAPGASDTALQTEIVRKTISTRTVSGKIATFKTFFNQNEGNGSLKEAGLFGDAATGVSGSGTLFCRTNINRVKTSSDTLTLEWNVTIG